MANTLKILFLFLMISHGLWCQNQGPSLLWPDSFSNTALKEEVQQFVFANADSANQRFLATRLRTFFQKKGYWLAEVNYTQKDSSGLSLIPGEILQLGTLKPIFEDSLTAPQPASLLSPVVLSENAVEIQLSYYLNFYQENGYPFAQASLLSYNFIGDTLVGQIALRPGPYVDFDSIVLKGYSKFSTNLLRYDLEFYKGKPYAESYLNELEKLVAQVEYLSFQRPPAVAFFKNKTTLFLYPKAIKGNQIDGVVGLNTTPEGETSINGDFKLRLLNILNKGEDIELRWRRPDESVQELEIALQWPYLFKTPVWADVGFTIFRQDSSFVNTNFDGLLKYRLAQRSFLTGGINYRASNALLSNSSNESPLASLTTFNALKYVLGAEVYRLNRVLIPTKGYSFLVYGKTGQRTRQEASTNQIGWQIETQWLYNFYKKMVLKTALNSQALIGENLFENELFRLGGLRTLRGFNEQSIFSSAYGVATVEYRYMIGEYDYLTLFSDIAYTEKRVQNELESNWLTGLGTGINFRTNGGIFSLFLAVGRSQDVNFDFRTTKVHFGYVNQF
jgi:outer membrane translocation and assembly module TamA